MGDVDDESACVVTTRTPREVDDGWGLLPRLSPLPPPPRPPRPPRPPPPPLLLLLTTAAVTVVFCCWKRNTSSLDNVDVTEGVLLMLAGFGQVMVPDGLHWQHHARALVGVLAIRGLSRSHGGGRVK